MRRALLLHNVIANNIRGKYAGAHTQKEKKAIRNVTASRNIVMKYRMGRQFFLSMGVRPSRNVSEHALDTNRKQRANAFANIISAQIRKYYERDDISRITTGTRDTITRGGIKQQRIVLLDTILNLHGKFREEFPRTNI